jgi:DNA-binding response OmpR family regulator
MNTVNVFLIEDNPADVELVREALDAAELQHVLEVAVDFEQAKRRLEGIRLGAPCPDILLMDLNLPKGNGFELLRLFRENTACHGVPVIVVSSSNAARDRDQAAELGAVNYFRKPTDLDEFLKLGQMVADSLQK